MNKKIELPLVQPMYSTYHNQGPGTATIKQNPSIRNWYLNEVMSLQCSRKFLQGFTTPELTIYNSYWRDNPHLEKHWYNMQFAKGYIHPIIRELLDNGYYVCFDGIDDYYVEGKTWYKKRHYSHDGMICGYDQSDKTYCIYAYDSNWVYQKFWTPQKSFDAGRIAMFKKGVYENICGIKPKEDPVEFCPEIALMNIREYLDSSTKKYPRTEMGDVFGIAVQDYIAMYIGKLYDGSIPYERMDRRVFRLIWEHKQVMLERIQKIENTLNMDSRTSAAYTPLVAESDKMHMLYASYRMRRKDSILPIIQGKLIALKKKERELLSRFVKKAERVIQV